MRVAFLGMGGPLSLAVLDAVRAPFTVTAVLQAAPPAGRRARLAALAALAARLPGLRHRDPLRFRARQCGARFVQLSGTGRSSDQAVIASHAADVLLVAGCPFLVADDVLGRFARAAVNVHPALLPRHRGLLPYFWVYWHGDAQSGVTAHRMVRRADAGAILAAESFPVPRGWPVEALNAAAAQAAGPVTAAALNGVACGEPGRAQDEALATRAPFVQAGAAMIPFDAWDVERVWHTLHGLQRYFREPLADVAGQPVRYEAVGRFTPGTPDLEPGTVRRTGADAQLACHGGWITLHGTVQA